MSLPLSEQQIIKATKWMKQNFEGQIKEYVANTHWDINLVCAISCQETAFKWLHWIDEYDALTILQRCVFDASGDFPGTARYAFPKNKTEFQQKYGSTITKMLIDEGNKQRSMPQPDAPKGYSEAEYLYKGYGIFQYDLQNIKQDPDFFLQKRWYNFSDCLQKLIDELNAKSRIASNLFGIVKAYNGSGIAADNYANNVMQFRQIITNNS